MRLSSWSLTKESTAAKDEKEKSNKLEKLRDVRQRVNELEKPHTKLTRVRLLEPSYPEYLQRLQLLLPGPNYWAGGAEAKASLQHR
jgi:hypothetical protein